MDPGPLWTGQGGWTGPDRTVQCPDGPKNIRRGILCEFGVDQLAQRVHVEAPIGECVGRARPAATKHRLEAESDRGGGPIGVVYERLRKQKGSEGRHEKEKEE